MPLTPVLAENKIIVSKTVKVPKSNNTNFTILKALGMMKLKINSMTIPMQQ